MKRLTLISLLTLAAATFAPAQNIMHYRVVGRDTVFVETLPASRIVAKGRDWKKNRKLVHNFSKTYPYALEAKRVMAEVDGRIAGEGLKRRKKAQYINSIQGEILDRYEPVIRDMTVSQGKLLIKLIGRETGYTPYEIIDGYKSGMAAGFWQGLAKMFGGDLKKRYDPYGEDALTEELVQKWQRGEFRDFYRSIFGKYPDIPSVPGQSSSKK